MPCTRLRWLFTLLVLMATGCTGPVAGHTLSTPPHGQYRLFGQAQNPGPRPLSSFDDPEGDVFNDDFGVEAELGGVVPLEAPPHGHG